MVDNEMSASGIPNKFASILQKADEVLGWSKSIIERSSTPVPD